MSGLRTYIVAAVMIGLVFAKSLGYITAEAYQEIQAILVGLGFMALRAGIKNDCKM